MTLAAASATVASPSRSSPYDGGWEIVWPCSRKGDDVWAHRCAEGNRNRFVLQLWSTGKRLCGIHEAVAQLGNKVDEDENYDPSVVGSLGSGQVIVQFRSAWGATGRALLRLDKRRLHWRILDTDGKDHWLPREAVLVRKRKLDINAPPPCSGQLTPEA